MLANGLTGGAVPELKRTVTAEAGR
jgi:hypothetical protein